ncbi:MAG TPA: SDR family oxidoreductase [Terriglobales bacterium]|nr:SDR family oxidoreductase [Terriglobales bacterium]
MKDRPLLQKVAVVTGASRGIGLAIAEALAAAGCSLALCSRKVRFIPEQDIANRNGVRVLVHECDVRSEESVADFFRSVQNRYTTIDFLINNAGTTHPVATIDSLSLENWRDSIETNLNGLFLCTRASLPILNNGGAIVNNLSVAAKTAFPGEAAYIASKHGAKGFTDTLREELRPRGIRVIGLIPGATDTDMWNTFWPDAQREKMMAPDTVAEALVQVLSLPQNATVEELVIAPTGGRL